VLGEPVLCFRFRDDGEDLDSFVRDVIEHPHFSNPKPILRLTQAPQALDPALAHPGRLVSQVPFQRVPNFGPMVPGTSRPIGRMTREEGGEGLRHQARLLHVEEVGRAR
jgi:hypothetical protein